ncbi:MAG TPA: hypothetical protein VGI57_01130 [Usitatibacter sp.]
MKSFRNLVLAAVAAGGLAVGVTAEAATHGGGGGGGGHGSWSGGHGGWSGGSHGSSWHGGGGYHGGGYGHGGHYHGYYPYHATAVGFYFGAPWVWGPWYWGGYPYDGYYGYGGYAPYSDYPPPAAPAGYPEGVMQGPETTEVDPNAPGAPTQAPAYMNYCVSAKAYFPKVNSCPEGWKFVPTH